MKVTLSTSLLIKGGLSYDDAQRMKAHFSEVLKGFAHVYIDGSPGSLEVRYRPLFLMGLKSSDPKKLGFELKETVYVG